MQNEPTEEPSESRCTNTSDDSGSGGTTNRPETLDELFAFYVERCKPLVAYISAHNVAVFRVVVEIAAAFDHLSRHWSQGQDEKHSVEKTSGHLKRACFDVYKLILKQAMDNYHRLASVDTSAIDNGEFDKRCIRLVRQIRTQAKYARMCEGNAEEDWHLAFDVWDRVYRDCLVFDNDFYGNVNVNWAKRRRLTRFVDALVLTIVGGVLGAGIWTIGKWCWAWWWSA